MPVVNIVTDSMSSGQTRNKMEICDKGHDKICHESKYCPCCICLDRIEELKEEIRELETELDRNIHPNVYR